MRSYGIAVASSKSTATPQGSSSLSFRNVSPVFSSQSIEFIKYPTTKKSDEIACNCMTGSANQSSQTSFVIECLVIVSVKSFTLVGSEYCCDHCHLVNSNREEVCHDGVDLDESRFEAGYQL